ncbi:MAG: hypothetical protein LIO85_01290 [Rikenellaceae bacterium]|nr:hypothetical protein [Rikenellaceae bacterium]
MEYTTGTEKGFFQTDTAALDRLIGEYPWFVSARIRRMQSGGGHDEMLDLAIHTKGWPAGLFQDTVTCDPQPQETAPEPGQPDTEDIIERFLATGAKRIVPGEETPTGDASEPSSVFVPDEDMDTEELERIYRQQGLDRMADEMNEIIDETIEEI